MKKFFTWFFLGVIGVMTIYVAINMPGSTYNGIGGAIVEAAPKTKALNVVTAVVFDFRGYDTIGESFVLFTAVTASAAVLRKSVSHKKEKGVK